MARTLAKDQPKDTRTVRRLCMSIVTTRDGFDDARSDVARLRWRSLVLLVALCADVAGCLMPGPVDPPPSAASAPRDEPAPVETPSQFKLKPEWNGPCARAEPVDVNLGNAPESFVRAAFCQIVGQEPPANVVESWSAKLVHDPHVRRIDVVRSLCADNKREAKLRYSDPWVSQPDLLDAPIHRSGRDVGAVLMFFFNCPGGV